MYGHYLLLAVGQKCTAVRIDTSPGRLHIRTGNFPADVLGNLERRNGDSRLHCATLLTQGYERQGYVWICELTGKVTYEKPETSYEAPPSNEKHIYWEFRPPTSGEESLEIKAKVENWLESISTHLQSTDVCGEYVISSKTFRINEWFLTIAKDQQFDVCRTKSNGVIRTSDGIEPVLFMLALKAGLPAGSWRNSLILAYEDTTEVNSDLAVDTNKLAKLFGYADLESVREKYEAFQLLKPRFNLAKQMDGEVQTDWF